MLPAERRLPDLLPYVEAALYFVLHAPRQVGKTTAMLALAERLRGLGYAALWASLETSQGVETVEAAEPLWLRSIERRAGELPAEDQPPEAGPFIAGEPGQRIGAYLREWARRCGRPVVLLLDEADVVGGSALISLLRQLRDGFVGRGLGAFPVSVGLIGMRDLRDYLATASDGRVLNPGSPFNIKQDSITLRSFTAAEVVELLDQHRQDTGQAFLPAAAALIYEQTRGQPFLVNALAARCVASGAGPIGEAEVWAAREGLIAARTTHLDSLAVRLEEPRVARVVEAVLMGDRKLTLRSDDFAYTVDLGLIEAGPPVEVANPIYREILARLLTEDRQAMIPAPWWPWRRPDGGLDMGALVAAFLPWWCENAAMVAEEDAGQYPEAVAHLTFMAFLQRVVNGGGRVSREFAAGRGAVDLLVEYRGERFAIELKRVRPRHDALERIREEGARQLEGYLRSLGLKGGWLLVFDQRPGRAWSDRLWAEDREVDGLILHLRGA
jgi:hypothetical protein